MKRFFKLPEAPIDVKPSMEPVHPGHLSNRTGLNPKYTVPPVPHPIPYQLLDVLVSSGGLLLRPHIPGFSHAESYIRITWGLAGKVELIENTVSKGPELDWSKAAVVYGILGSLDLFTGMLTPFVVGHATKLWVLFV